ncbi:MAG: hypothetical protein LC798_05250 [Chloroflexi bacterium]|nr:hypothetical protein [Chloroflexota bacterium]
MPQWEVIEEFTRRKGITFGAGSRTRPGDPGFHGRGQARDFGNRGAGNSPASANAISALFVPIARAHPALVPEVFGHDGVGVDEGKTYQAGGHTGDHTHVAIGAGVTVEQLEAASAGMMVGAGVGPMIPVSETLDLAGGWLRRLLMVLAGALLMGWGLGLLGIDLLGGTVARFARSRVGI